LDVKVRWQQYQQIVWTVRYIFLGETFPSGIKCLTHAYSNKEAHIKVKKLSAWVAYLDKQKKKENTFRTPMSEIK
jgi:hypothetical protein